MSAHDISRFLFQPHKRYTGVRMQQGRVILDSDWNEGERIDDEDARQAQLELICSRGTPNEGFLVSDVTEASVVPVPGANPQATYDFEWALGSFYLGGLRFQTAANPPERFLRQQDWLQVDADPANLPKRPSAADLTNPDGTTKERYDLVYLHGWEQVVTAVEDRELREVALGGPDTSARIRRMRRVKVLPDCSASCANAFDDLKAHLTAPREGDDTGTPHGFDDVSCELLSKAKLTVSLGGEDLSEDLCKPKATAGFLGAENQTIRVALTAPDQFIWGYDNASPLYRVQVLSLKGALVKIKFLTQPRDQAAQPLKGQAVEILPWSALLPNQEKVAELRGHLATVTTSFNPDDPDGPSVTIATPVPQAWLDWFDAPAHAPYLSERDPDKEQKYFYLRLWTGGSGDAAHPDHPFTPGDAVSLAGTGLNVTFSDPGLPGDHWIIAARPHTPATVVPWELMQEAPPAGTRAFFAPLALIRWSIGGTAGGSDVTAQVHDCRTTFRPLCEVGGCCTVIVGDGHESVGDVQSIQQALDKLPPTGGEVCLLPGTFRGPVVLEGRRHVTIRGCGPRSLLLAEPGQTDPVVWIKNCRDVTLESFTVQALEGRGIEMEGGAQTPLERITLADLAVTARDRSAVAGRGGRGIVLRNNEVSVGSLTGRLGEDPQRGQEPAVFLAGDDLWIERNRIQAQGMHTRDRVPFGGLQIGGGSNRVEIRDNAIEGGNGNGITLGSFRYVPTRESDAFERFTAFSAIARLGFAIVIDGNGCLRLDPLPPPPREDGGVPLVPVADEGLMDVRISHNVVSEMGASGISVVRFFDLEANPDFITVDRLTIEHNHIHHCMQAEVGEISPGLRPHAAFGGIALADGEYTIIRDNTIEYNGISYLDPICGVFVLHTEGLAVDGNRILHNGRPVDPEQTPRPGRRGGLIVAMAQTRKLPVAPLGSQWSGSRQDGVPAAWIHNNVVVAPEGRALEIVAIGPVSVEGNALTAHGSHALNRVPLPGGSSAAPGTFRLAPAAAVPIANRSTTTDPVAAFLDALGGEVVSIVNLGVSNEVYLQLLGMSGLGLLDAFPEPEGQDEDVRLFVGGNILFNDNQVVFDAFSPAVTLSLSAVVLLTLDDVSMAGNQCDCDLLLDFIGTNALVAGWSLRVADNRFKEGLLNARLSALTMGLMNATTDNQGTHCFVATGIPALSVTSPNRTLAVLFQKDACQPYQMTDVALGKKMGFTTPAS